MFNGSVDFPEAYFSRVLSPTDESELVNLLEGEFLAFPQKERKVDKTVYVRGPPNDLNPGMG